MTRYEQGFMRKCAEHGVDGRRMLAGLRKRAAAMVKRAQDWQSAKDWEAQREAQDKAYAEQAANYFNTYFPKNIHAPVTYGDIMGAVDNFPDAVKDPLPAVPAFGDLFLQRLSDSLPDPGPGVRNPTMYELAEFYKNMLADTANNGDDSPRVSALRNAFRPTMEAFGLSPNAGNEEADDNMAWFLRHAGQGRASLVNADPKLGNEALRRVWNTATNAAPISVTSPTPVGAAAKPAGKP